MSKFLKSIVIFFAILIVLLISIIVFVIIKKYNNNINKPVENIEIFPKLNQYQEMQSFDINDRKIYIHVFDSFKKSNFLFIYDLSDGKKVGSILIEE
jgi:hypothetical protein